MDFTPNFVFINLASPYINKVVDDIIGGFDFLFWQSNRFRILNIAWKAMSYEMDRRRL